MDQEKTSGLVYDARQDQECDSVLLRAESDQQVSLDHVHRWPVPHLLWQTSLSVKKKNVKKKANHNSNVVTYIMIKSDKRLCKTSRDELCYLLNWPQKREVCTVN